MADVTVLDVLLYGEPIGTLTRVAGDNTLFAFNDAYIADDARPVLSLGFKDQFGALITNFNVLRSRLEPFFANLLPEGPMRRYLAMRAGVGEHREFFLLWVLGMDLPGAVTIRPADGEAWPPDTDDGDDHHQDERRRENVMRFSLAGVQLKFSAVTEPSGGLTIPAKGIGGSWIVKLPSQSYAGVPENEYAMMTLAWVIGMDVPAVQLIDLDAIANLPEGISELKGKALAVERFDRLPDGSLVHIEDFAQIFRVYPEAKYEKATQRGIAKVIGAECGEDDIAEFIRRVTFNTLIGNGDMHLKNWSLIYPDRHKAALAPAYDLLSTVPYIANEDSALTYSRTKRFAEFTADELAHLAAGAMLPEKLVLDTARETVALFHEHWETEKKNLPLAASVIEAVEKHLRTVPIA